MQPFTYARPTTLAATIALLARHGSAARLLAGGTDLIIRLRDGTLEPTVVVDLKHVAELAPGIHDADDGGLRIAATTVMAEVMADPRVRRDYEALAEAAGVVGSVQIRNRATLAGNLCNASPAADTSPLRTLDPEAEQAMIATEVGSGHFQHPAYDPYDPLSLTDAHGPLPAPLVHHYLPGIPGIALLELAQADSRETVGMMLVSARVRRSANVLHALVINPHVTIEEAEQVLLEVVEPPL